VQISQLTPHNHINKIMYINLWKYSLLVVTCVVSKHYKEYYTRPDPTDL